MHLKARDSHLKAFGIQSHLLNTEDKDPDENESSDYKSIAVDHKEVLRARGIPETGVDDSTDVDDEDHFEIDTNQAVNNADDEVVEVDDENTKFAISETDEKVSCNQCNIIRAMMRKNMLAAENGIATSKIEEREFFGYIMCSQCEEREGERCYCGRD
ncbi:hypothetical protein DID88_005114 [Monilinia fructigena]|uniref:Uncharacterized protein n=1 Tax=Monilinia fructigena TaxID=38457 RepID=A0A395IJ41_9HELO|nr:hypothetical protein DID88_005114 [Monilinia fructigena]